MNEQQACIAELHISSETRCRPDLDDIDAANILAVIEQLQARVAELEAENANLLAANRDCIEQFNAMQQDLAAAQLQIKTLRDALETTHELYVNASQGYGFARPNNPHNFFPDIDCCTPEEIAAHSKACSDYDSGNAISPDSWGIGTYCDEFDGAVKALSQPTSTEALDAYVSEKVKEQVSELVSTGNKVMEVANSERLRLYSVTKQRDLAVEALEKWDMFFGGDAETAVLTIAEDPSTLTGCQKATKEAMSAIKESEAK